MGKKITQYPNNVSTNPDNLSLLDLSEKTGASTFESRKWNLTAFKAWVNSWVVASSVAWSNITGKPNVVDTTGGTANYVAKFTDTDTIEESQIQDNGTIVGIGYTPAELSAITSTKIALKSIDKTIAIDVTNEFADGIAIYGNATGAGNRVAGIKGITGNSANVNIGVSGTGNSTTGKIGIGGDFNAQGSGTNYALQLRDGTEGTGKFLKCIDGAQGYANWADISVAWNDITSKPTLVDTTGGTANYISKFTDANTIEESQIQDDGSTLAIGSTPSSAIKLNIQSNKSVGIAVSQSSQGTSIDGRSIISGSSANFGVITFASNSTTQNIGIDSVASGGATSSNIGLRADVSGGLTNYCFQGKDGTEGEGKFLKSVTSDGKANWGYIPKVVQLAVSDETTALTTGTGKITFRMPHAMTLTEVRASLTTAQTSGSILTVNVRENGGQIFSTKLTIDNTEKTSVTATTPYILQDTSLGDDSEITVDIDQLGDGTAKGLKITLIGY